MHSGVTRIPPEITKRLVSHGVPGPEITDGAPLLESLTKREREILELLINACDNREIAAHLGVSAQTVKSYVHGPYEKLGVSSRLQPIKAMGLYDP